MTPEKLDEIEAQINEFGEESGFILPLVKALREAWAAADIAKAFHDVAVKERDYERVRANRIEKERDDARAEVERLRGLLKTVWEDACEQEAGFLDEVCDAVEAALREGDR